MPSFEYQSVPQRTALEAASVSMDFFWAMLLITGKYAARSPQEERMGLLEYVVKPLNEVGDYLDAAPAFQPGAIPDHAAPSEKLWLLRTLAARMEELMPRLEARGASVPWPIIPSARDYLTLVEAIMTPPS